MLKKKRSNRIDVYGERLSAVIDVPPLLDLQVKSFKRFVELGLGEELQSVSPIQGYGGRFELEFLPGHKLDQPELPYEECQRLELTYSAPLRVPVRLIDKETGEVKEQEVFMGDIPIMTDYGSFLINGAERVVVSQFVRSPGVYFRRRQDTARGKVSYLATIIPNRGAWLEIESDHNNVIWAHINKMRKIPVTVLLGAIGYEVDEMLNRATDRDVLLRTLEKGPVESSKDALMDIYRKLRPGDPITYEGARLLLDGLFFNPQKYDLGKVGRYKINKRLDLKTDPEHMSLTNEDIFAVVNYVITLINGGGQTDDIDHLGNRRIRTVGELLQKQFRVGLARLERLIREQMTIKGSENIVPQHLINIRPLVAVMREFFGSSQLSQFMDQTNPLSEIGHKRRLSALGPGGLTKERAGFEVRDIHPSHYGRICPIETPEGPNAGLIGPLATYSRVNDMGFLESPYRRVMDGKVSTEIHYLTADEEDKFMIAPWDVRINTDGSFMDKRNPARLNKDFIFTESKDIGYVGVSPRQLLGITTALIPFLEHDDANRALMGANMQRQATPLMYPEPPTVGSGLEAVIARDCSALLKAREAGEVVSADAQEIIIKTDQGKRDVYKLVKYQRSNQNTCRNQRPVVKAGDLVSQAEPIADGTSIANGELALGRNVLVAFMPWEGYNFEDAIMVSERLVTDDIFTSIHIHRYEIDVRTTKLGPEELTREVPNVSEEALKDLSEDGVIRIGAEVSSGDILVGKVTPKGETEPPAEEKLLRAIFGDKARDMRDTSLRVSSGQTGKVIDIRILSRDKNDDLPPGVNQVVRVYVAQRRKVMIGDKIAGRHGNKGVVSIIMPQEDMPMLPDGRPIDIVLNPLGVPSRMNVGQLFETMLGLAGNILGEAYTVPSFDEVLGEEQSVKLVVDKLNEAKRVPGFGWISTDGKVRLRDGRTGDYFDREVMVGYMYIMKLIHMVEDKMHARSTGPYSLVTQQPLGGKAQFGGQRFGEMEVWTLEAYGAAHTLQELLTIKSDDVSGRAKAYESIIKGKVMARPGTPESFRVLLRELRSIALDVRVQTKDEIEVDTR